jgi:hypothetical protein
MEVETTAGAESSAAATQAAVEQPKFTNFDGWDEDGNPVVTKKAESSKPADAGKPKEAEAAAADTSKETKTDDAADSAAKKTQENRRKPDAEARIRELTSKLKERDRELEEARKPKETKADSSTARQTEQDSSKKPAQQQATRPKPTMDDLGADGKPKYKSYEEFSEALVDYKVAERIANERQEQQAAQQRTALDNQLKEARTRYTDFDSVTKPLVHELLQPDVPREVFAVINESPVLADLLYTLGGTEATKADFLDACRNNPGKALRVALLMEQEIAKELGKGKAGAKKEGEASAESTSATTAKPRAPKPPTEVGGRGAPGEDALISAAKANDFRQFEAEQTRRALASRR